MKKSHPRVNAAREYIDVQKGPINMEAQYNAGFEREPEMTMRDMQNMAMRRDMMTMTKHEPKR